MKCQNSYLQVAALHKQVVTSIALSQVVLYGLSFVHCTVQPTMLLDCLIFPYFLATGFPSAISHSLLLLRPAPPPPPAPTILDFEFVQAPETMCKKRVRSRRNHNTFKKAQPRLRLGLAILSSAGEGQKTERSTNAAMQRTAHQLLASKPMSHQTRLRRRALGAPGW